MACESLVPARNHYSTAYVCAPKAPGLGWVWDAGAACGWALGQREAGIATWHLSGASEDRVHVGQCASRWLL